MKNQADEYIQKIKDILEEFGIPYHNDVESTWSKSGLHSVNREELNYVYIEGNPKRTDIHKVLSKKFPNYKDYLPEE